MQIMFRVTLGAALCLFSALPAQATMPGAGLRYGELLAIAVSFLLMVNYLFAYLAMPLIVLTKLYRMVFGRSEPRQRTSGASLMMRTAEMGPISRVGWCPGLRWPGSRAACRRCPI